MTFHRHEGLFSVDLDDGEIISVSSKEPAELKGELKRIPGLQRALNFYRLACTPQFEKDGKTPRLDGYQATRLDRAGQKLTELRNRMPDAGGLVIAPSIEMAEYMVSLIERMEGEKPILVHSQLPNADSKINAFRRTDKRWLVSVAMVSEGVDIPRLRVLIYLSSALTELAFRQAVEMHDRSSRCMPQTATKALDKTKGADGGSRWTSQFTATAALLTTPRWPIRRSPNCCSLRRSAPHASSRWSNK